jgi:coenzyme F420-reducing hydrogenase beta subunit
MRGVYNNIRDLLKKGEKIFFCSTPCQVSALKNSLSDFLLKNLFTAEILCHGVPPQKLFDEYIKSLEEKHGGKIAEFSFRVKDNKYRHSNGFSYKVIKNNGEKIVNGVYPQSSYYYAFKHYLILRESCYDCLYSTAERVADITLGDFWGIEKYGFGTSTDIGVSKVITNTIKGERAFSEIKNKIIYKEFPFEVALDQNHCLKCGSVKPDKRDEILLSIKENGYETTAKKYFKDKNYIKRRLFWFMPTWARNFIRKLKG